MQFTIATLFLAASASATSLVVRDDGSYTDPTTGSSMTCAKGSQISCCTSTSGDSGLLGNVLGGSCLLSQVSLLSILDNICPAGNTFCCPTTQNGTLNINLSCIPINL